jgi:hypothetical protein
MYRKRWDLQFFCIILLFSDQRLHIVRLVFAWRNALCKQSWLHLTAGSDALQLGNVNDENYLVSIFVLKLDSTIFQGHDLKFRAALISSSYILHEVKGWCYWVRERISLKLSVLFWWSHVWSPWDVLSRGKGVRGAYIRCLNYVRHILSEVWDPKVFTIDCLYSWDSKLGMSREDPWRHSVRSGSVLLA